MDPQTFEKRAMSLEDEFFRRVDQRLAARLREQWNRERELDALREETHISDQRVLEELLDVGIHPGMIRAVLLVPAITVAWANGYVETHERQAVLQAAERTGIHSETDTGKLLTSWLDHQPGPELFTAWRDYVTALHRTVDRETFRHLHESAVSMAQKIARTAGGILGLHRVSAAEQNVISRVNDAFQSPE